MAISHWWLGTTSSNPSVAANWSTVGSGGAPGASVPGTGNEVQFDGGGNNACTFTAPMTFAGLATLVGYTDTISLLTYDLTIDDGGSIILNQAGTFNMGSATVSLTNGTFDNEDCGTFTRGTSTLVMSGVGNLITATAKIIHNFTVSTGAVIAVPTYSFLGPAAQNIINGTLSIAVSKFCLMAGQGTVGPEGRITGDGEYRLYQNATGRGIVSLSPTAVIDIAEFTIDRPVTGTVVAPGTYSPGVFRVYNDGGSPTRTLSLDGDYVFEQDLEFRTANLSDSILIIDNATHSPNITCNGDVRWTEHVPEPPEPFVDTLIYLAGNNGSLTLDGIVDQDIDFGDSVTEEITISKAAGDVLLDSLESEIGEVDMDLGDLTIVGSTITSSVAAKNITGNIDFSDAGNDITFGDGATWTVGGNFDNSTTGTWVEDGSTLVMTGTGNLVTATANQFVNVTIAAGAITTLTTDAFFINTGQHIINGVFSVDVNKNCLSSGQVSVGAAGQITGDGEYRLYMGTSGRGLVALSSTAIIDVAEFSIDRPVTGTVLVPGTYAPTLFNVFCSAESTDKTLSLAAGNYIFQNNVTFKASAFATAALTIDNATHNPIITYMGNVTIIETESGTVTYSAGALPTTLSGIASQVIDFNDKVTENLTIDKQISGNVTLQNVDLTLASSKLQGVFTVSSGDVDTETAAILYMNSDVTLSNNQFDMGDGTIWYICGTFDYNGVTTYNAGTSTVIVSCGFPADVDYLVATYGNDSNLQKEGTSIAHTDKHGRIYAYGGKEIPRTEGITKTSAKWGTRWF